MPVEYATEISGSNAIRITTSTELSVEKTKAGTHIKLCKKKKNKNLKVKKKSCPFPLDKPLPSSLAPQILVGAP